MNNINKLARATYRNGKIDQKVTRFAFANLTRKELIIYLAALRKIIYENSVRVISSQELPTKMKQLIQSKFKDKEVFFEIDEEQATGIKVIMDDTTLDLTINGYISGALEQLKI